MIPNNTDHHLRINILPTVLVKPPINQWGRNRYVSEVQIDTLLQAYIICMQLWLHNNGKHIANEKTVEGILTFVHGSIYFLNQYHTITKSFNQF